MRVRLALDVGPATRYIVAQYYGGGRARATRAEVRRFAAAAVETMAQDWSQTLRPRAYRTAQRLLAARPDAPETIDDRPLRQPRLF